MKRKYIPVEEAFARWREDPEYVAAYDALEEEFAPAASLMGHSRPPIAGPMTCVEHLQQET